MAKELSEVIQTYKAKLKIPREIPEHWKKSNGQTLAQSQTFHCQLDCQVCAGQDYYRLDVPRSHEDFGKVFLCPNINRMDLPGSAKFGISKDETESLSWGSMKRFNGVVGMAQAQEVVKETLRRGYGWVFIHGDFGIGKTLILKIATALTLQAGDDAAYVRMAEILDNLRAAFDDNSTESESARMDWWTDLPVLCIDEFDKVRKTEYGKERSFVLLDRRYEQAIRQESVTIIASNEPPDSFDGYLYDRIRDGRFFVREIRGESARPGMRW